ncbi:D-inositol-3-phosphate glycosyltransferase [subsurface metagenome]
MKILMILDREFPPDLRVENEIETLQQKGHEIHLACFTRKDRLSVEKTGDLTIHRVPISDFIYKSSVGALTFPFYFNFWRKFLYQILKREQFDAIHVHDLPLVRVGVELKNKYNVPLVADLHENWPAYLRISKHTKSIMGRILSPNRKWIHYEREILQYVDRIIVVVEEAKNRLARLNLNEENIHVVSNTLNIKHFNIDIPKTHPGEIVLFYAGGITYHRGLQTVIKALSLARKSVSDICFRILGEGRYQAELMKLIKQLDLGEYVVFHGWQPYEKMIGLLTEADFAVIPHLKSEHTDTTIPHKLFQYMYAEKPVIASNCEPVERIIRETNSGYIYTAGKYVELANILEGLAKNNDKELGRNGKFWVKEKYNWELDSQVLINVYEKLQQI